MTSTASTSLRRTPLTSQHEQAGAKLVDFSGFLMPVQYEGILDEVRRVRTQAGTFDLCHMGRCRILQHPFTHQFGAAIGTPVDLEHPYRSRRECVFTYRDLAVATI